MNFLSLCPILCVAINFVCSSQIGEYIEKKIINGRKAKPMKYPYAVSILTTSRPHICGGSIITQKLVTSACHCFRKNESGSVEDTPPLFLQVRAGIINLQYSSKSEQLRFVDDVYIHPKCVITDTNLHYDVAMLRVSASFKFNKFVKPIRLPFSLSNTRHGYVNLTYYMENRLYCYIAGWGKNNYNNISDDLMEIAIPLMPYQDCFDRILRISNGFYSLSDSSIHICASVIDGKDACTGDSGSGLKCGNYLLGMVSWGIGCAQSGYPAVFANIHCARAFFRDVFLSKGNILTTGHTWLFVITILYFLHK